MPDVEIKRKVRLSREEAAQRLIAIGNALADSSTTRLHFDGDSIQFTVANQVEWEFRVGGRGRPNGIGNRVEVVGCFAQRAPGGT